MPYGKVKVYSDGGHFIGIPYKPNTSVRKRRGYPEEVIAVPPEPVNADSDSGPSVERSVAVQTSNKTEKDEMSFSPKMTTRKELFEELYTKTAGMSRREGKDYIERQMSPYFEKHDQCAKFTEENIQRKQRNLICRKVRMWRKINQQTFNFFVTFTYDEKLHTEESFRKSLSRCLQHFSSRKEWRYIGVWERSPEKQRLHFHGIFRIPDGTLPGSNEPVTTYDVNETRMRTAYVNSFFAKRFGRNDFKEIVHSSELPQAIKYMTKYLEKTGEKLVYSRGLYQYFVTDIMDDDILCPYGRDDRKFVLADDFECWDDGEYIGKVGPETIARLPKHI